MAAFMDGQDRGTKLSLKLCRPGAGNQKKSKATFYIAFDSIN